LRSIFAIPNDWFVKLRTDVEYREGEDISIGIQREEWLLLQDHVRVVNLKAFCPIRPPKIMHYGDDTIIVEVITGKTFKIEGASISSNTVLEFKNRIVDREGIPPDQQRLVFAGKELEDDHTLGHYGIYSGAVLHLVLRLRGGWSWAFEFRQRRHRVLPLPRAQPLDPSQFIQKKTSFACTISNALF